MLYIDSPAVPVTPPGLEHFLSGQNNFIQGLIDLIMALPFFIFPLVILFGGFMYLTSEGEDQKLQRSKSIMTWGVAGLILYLLAFAILRLVGGAFGINLEPKIQIP